MGNCSGHDQDVAVSKVVQVFREHTLTPPPTPSSSPFVDLSDIPEEEIAETE